MTIIKQEDLIQSVADAFQYISYYHPLDFIKALEDARKQLPDGYAIQPERNSVSLMENGRYAVNGLSRTAAGVQEAVRLAKQRAEQATELAGRQKMIAALERLKLNHEQTALPAQMAAFGISGGGGMARLFMSHPPLDERIEALRNSR